MAENTKLEELKKTYHKHLLDLNSNLRKLDLLYNKGFSGSANIKSQNDYAEQMMDILPTISSSLMALQQLNNRRIIYQDVQKRMMMANSILAGGVVSGDHMVDNLTRPGLEDHFHDADLTHLPKDIASQKQTSTTSSQVESIASQAEAPQHSTQHFSNLTESIQAQQPQQSVASAPNSTTDNHKAQPESQSEKEKALADAEFMYHYQRYLKQQEAQKKLNEQSAKPVNENESLQNTQVAQTAQQPAPSAQTQAQPTSQAQHTAQPQDYVGSAQSTTGFGAARANQAAMKHEAGRGKGAGADQHQPQKSQKSQEEHVEHTETHDRPQGVSAKPEMEIKWPGDSYFVDKQGHTTPADEKHKDDQTATKSNEQSNDKNDNISDEYIHNLLKDQLRGL